MLLYKSTSKGPQRDKPLNDPGQFAVSVDVTPSRQLAAVSNGSSNTGAAGSVSVYIDRERDPARTLTYGSDPLRGAGVAIDRQGNCYWAFNDPNTNNGSIVKFEKCRGNGTIVVPAIANVEGIVFDQSGNLYYIDRSAGIYKCRKTSNCTLFSTGFAAPVALNFDIKRNMLWVADAAGYVDAIDPQNGKSCILREQIGGPRIRRSESRPRPAVRPQSRRSSSPHSSNSSALRAGLSQQMLADRALISVQAISALERGYRKVPYRKTLERLADALALSDDARAALELSARRVRGSRSLEYGSRHPTICPGS